MSKNRGIWTQLFFFMMGRKEFENGIFLYLFPLILKKGCFKSLSSCVNLVIKREYACGMASTP